MNLNSLCVLFFAITVGAFAPTEASSVLGAAKTGVAASPGDIASLADQHQQNNDVTPVQKESPQGALQQKESRLASVVAKVGAAALVLGFVFLFIKGAEHIKAYIAEEKEEEEVKLVEEAIQFEMRRIGDEIEFGDETMTEEESREEAIRRIKRRRQIYQEIKDKDPAKKAENLRRDAYKKEAWERHQARAKKYDYTPDRKEFNTDFEDEWEERETAFEMELIIGKEIVFEADAKTEDERREEAIRRMKRREEHFQKMLKDPANRGKSEEELRRDAHKEEAWERHQRRAKQYKYDADRQASNNDAEDAWNSRLKKQAQGLGLEQL